jgi:predicted Zn-dependent peptidase
MISSKFIKSYIVSFLFCALIATASFALIKSPPEKAILPNGMRIIAVEDKSLPIVSAGLLFQFQSIGEKFDNSGIGDIAVKLIRDADTEDRSRFEINQHTEKLGLMPQYGSNLPVFFMGCQGPAENLSHIFTLFKDVGFKLKPTKDDFRQAKEHARSRLSTRKAFPLQTGYLEDQLWQDVYGLKGCGAGRFYTQENLSKLEFEDYKTFSRKLFVPNNAVLVVVGNINASDIFRESMKFFGQFKASLKQENKVVSKKEAETNKEKVAKEYLKIKKTQVVIGFEAPSMTSNDFPAAMLWQAALSDINDSWLHFKFGKEFPELSDLTAKYMPLKNNGLFVIRFSSSHPDVDRPIASLLSSLGSLDMSAPKGRELAKLVNIKQLEYLEKREVRLDRAFMLGVSELTKSYKLLDSITNALQRVEADDMKRTARKIFGSNKYSVRIAYPLKYQKPSDKNVAYEELDNGLKIIANNYPGSEIAGISLRFGIDSCSKAKNSKTISRMLSEFFQIHINENEKISSKLDQIGAKLDAKIEDDSLIVIGKTQKKDLPELIRFIKQLIFNKEKKNKDKRDLRKVKERLIKRNNDRKGNIHYILYDEVVKRLFPGLEAISFQLDEEKIQKVTYQEVVNYHKNWAVASNMQCAVVGNFDPEQITKLIADEFKDLPRGNPQELSECPAWLNSPLKKTIEEEVSLPCGIDHATIVVAYRMKTMLNLKNKKDLIEHFGVNSVLAHVLFSSRNSIIARELDKINANLGVGGSFKSGASSAVFNFYASVPLDKVDQAKQVIKNVLASIPDLNVSQNDILSSGKIVKTIFNMVLQKSDYQAATMVQFLGYGLDHNYISELMSVYDQVTIEDVKKGARENFKNYLMLIAKPK